MQTDTSSCSKRLKESVLIDGSLMKSGRLFQTVGPATAKARPPCTPRSMYAISVLRSHGMESSALQQVFRTVVVSKLTYAALAWCGFTTSVNQQRLNAILRRAACSDLWTSAAKSGVHTFEDLCNSADEELLTKIRTFSNQILHTFLPPPSTALQNYSCFPFRARSNTQTIAAPNV